MQIVGFERRVGGDPAALLLSDGEDIQRVGLEPGATLDIGLGDRHCAGQVREDGHIPCSRSTSPYCDLHTSRWPCARCQGDCAMPIEDCHEEHAIYLAAFPPDIVKVGVTKHWRLETRLEEQGAVKAAHIRTVENGRKARAIEAELATDLTDRVRIPTKIAGLHRELDEAVWERTLESFDVIERFDFDYGIALDHQPVQETLASGTVLGTKGRILLVENAGTTYAVDLRNLVGHEVGDESAAVKRQSSLGAF